MAASTVDDFLGPLQIDIHKIHNLAKALRATFTDLAAESQEQFLPTPVSEDILWPRREGRGNGGTNLRVGFIELLGSTEPQSSHKVVHTNDPESVGHDPESSRVLRHQKLEKAWPIGEHLKQDKPGDLFHWIGTCIAEVVQDGCDAWPGEFRKEVPLGVSFSFPMQQETISQATIMAMGKGFVMKPNSNLGVQLQQGYELARSSVPSLPALRIVAITNDAVATLISFTYQYRNSYKKKATMGLIAGTGSNATIPMSISKLHSSKRPSSLSKDTKITINTEWTIRGASKPLHDLGFFTKWDKKLDSECEAPGFQPFEYMTSGRYLGELGRIIVVEYLTTQCCYSVNQLPEKLRRRIGLTTSFLGNLGPHLAITDGEEDMVKQLERELPSSDPLFRWSDQLAEVVFAVAKAVQVRAAGITAAAIIGLLACAGEINLPSLNAPPELKIDIIGDDTEKMLSNGIHKYQNLEEELNELMVGYTGGCIVHFQDYLTDCQSYLDQIMAQEFGHKKVPRIVLMPCHDGGILGAGILAGTVQAL